MPLVQGSSRQAVSENIRRERDVGKKQSQAVAIALDIARRNKMAAGGMTPDTFARGAMHSIQHAGLIHSPIAGRTDHIPIHVPVGSYVLPADHVSGLGQGNTLAGSKVLDHMFQTSTPHLHANIPRPPKIGKFANGGASGDGTVPIIVAGGEYLVHPDQIERKFGDLNKGHNAIDEWVKSERRKHVKTLKSLPGPKK